MDNDNSNYYKYKYIKYMKKYLKIGGSPLEWSLDPVVRSQAREQLTRFNSHKIKLYKRKIDELMRDHPEMTKGEASEEARKYINNLHLGIEFDEDFLHPKHWDRRKSMSKTGVNYPYRKIDHGARSKWNELANQYKTINKWKRFSGDGEGLNIKRRAKNRAISRLPIELQRRVNEYEPNTRTNEFKRDVMNNRRRVANFENTHRRRSASMLGTY